MELGLKGKVALVTGASKGIGRAVAAALAAEGARVAICARDSGVVKAAAAAIATETGSEVLPISADMSRLEDVERFVEEAAAHFGRIDILVTCAGSAPAGLPTELSEEAWNTAIGLKLLGYIRSARAVVPHLRRQGKGRIIFVAGNAGKEPGVMMATAGVTNASVTVFAKALSQEVASAGITVNVVSPGLINTDRGAGLIRSFARARGVSEAEARRDFESRVPVGRLGEAVEVADLVVFLASDRAGFINGVSVSIDGGARQSII